MSLFDAPDPRKVELKGSTAQTAPQYLTDYLSSLAGAGQGALGTTVDGKTTPFAGKDLIAELPQNLQDLYKNAGTTLNRYQSPMDESLTALQDAAKGVSSSDISQFYNPYEQDVVDEMGRQSALNVQQSMLPALRAAFAGQGGFGSQRYAGAMGQAMGNVQSDLFGNQAKLRSEGYKTALDAALRDRGYDIQTGQALGGLGQQEAQAATTGLKTLGDIGAQELGYDQSLIEAPLTRAQNVAQIMRGYTYPMSTAETKETLPGAFAPSPLQQIAGLGTLIGSTFGQTVNPKTGELMNTGAGYKGLDLVKDLYGNFKSLLPSGASLPDSGNLAGSYFDSQGNPII
jgi:hypothetical protein